MINSTRIAAIVAAEFEVPVAAIVRGTSRIVRFARARQAAMYLMRTKRRLSYPTIGRLLRKDHTTVMYAVKKVGALMESDADFALHMLNCGITIDAEIEAARERYREMRLNQALTLPMNITTDQVELLAGISTPALFKRIREQSMPLPIGKAGGRSIFDRDDVLRALGLLRAPEVSAPAVEEVAAL